MTEPIGEVGVEIERKREWGGDFDTVITRHYVQSIKIWTPQFGPLYKFHLHQLDTSPKQMLYTNKAAKKKK